MRFFATIFLFMSTVSALSIRDLSWVFGKKEKRMTNSLVTSVKTVKSTAYYNISEGTFCHTNGANLCVSPDVIAICTNHSTVLLNCPTILGYPYGVGSACVETSNTYGLTRGLCVTGSSNFTTKANASNFENATTLVTRGSPLKQVSLEFTNVIPSKSVYISRSSLTEWSCNQTLCNSEYPFLVNTCFNGTQYPVNCNSALRTSFGGAECRNVGYRGQGVCVYTNSSRSATRLNETAVKDMASRALW
ncbi:hypothetical protein SJAG_01755 [Schizosaccharomyces japonicus yFS275]|uniref:Uncharacterized protein n=1 Tax=Schizosaccharomyces japonicus (strain yFS275 / FY16936) TaxID=402676 RepID=B6JYT6_SCHJY|nr:hypothetical protein SJAG_01755 [Schizosaccharomyces japonicus yFS275]EEB06704.1 hypothetical protein SJAG_01755 [Schizosaccharomyces japonicus yFS275]